MKNVFYLLLILLIMMNPVFITGDDQNSSQRNPTDVNSSGRIGFLHEFGPESSGPVNEVIVGVEVYRNVLYKLTTVEDESVVSAGMLCPGINNITIPIGLITGKNKGVFRLFLKEGEMIICRQIVLIPDRYEVVEAAPESGTGEAVKDRHPHEVVVTGDNSNTIDMHTKIVMDSVTGDYPGLNQGIPVLPILYLLGSKIYRSLKRKTKRFLPLFSETELFIKLEQDNKNNARLSLRILISEM